MEHETDRVQFPREQIVKWLRVLLLARIASIAVSLISCLPVNDGWLQWISKAITVVTITALFQLAPGNVRYRKAAVFRTVMLGLTLITSLLVASTFLTLAASVLSLLSVYQEYSGHAEITADPDPKLSRNWHRLFNWGLAVGILTALVSMVMTLVLVMIGVQAGATTGIVMAVMTGAELIIDIFYLVFLNRTIRILQS